MCRRQHSQNSRSVSEKRNDGVSAYHNFTSSVAVPFPEAISPAKPSNNFFTLHLQWTYSVTHRTEFSVRSKQRYGKRILLTLSAAARARICGIVPHRHSFKLNDLIFDAVFSVEEFRIAGLICFFQREKFPLMPAVDKPNNEKIRHKREHNENGEAIQLDDLFAFVVSLSFHRYRMMLRDSLPQLLSLDL